MTGFKPRYVIIFIAGIISYHPQCPAQIWDSLGTDLRGEARHFKEYNGLLYVGIHDTVNGKILFNIGTWDGANWDSVGAGIDGLVMSSAKYNNKLFFGGDFDYVNGPWPGPATTPRIANFTSWDGTQFSDLDYPNSGAAGATEVLCLEEFQGELYLGLNYVTISGQTYYGIARYNDTTFSDVAGGCTGFPREVRAMTKFNNELIVGGFFQTAGTLITGNIARWNGTQWLPMDSGLSSGVLALFVDTLTNVLYAGGSFTYAGNTFVNHVAQWDGISWQPMSNGLSTAVFSLAMYHNKLFAGTTDNNGISSLWYWDGTQWNDVHPYPNGIVRELEVYQNHLYAGGGYYQIGGIPWAGIAKYTDTTTVGLPEKEFHFNIFPNPASNELMLDFGDPLNDPGEIEISDLRGKVILRLPIDLGCQEKQIILQDRFSTGLYICKFHSGESLVVKKIVVH
jgi:hypothetical protein